MPGTKSHFNSTDRAVFGQNEEHTLTGYLQPVSIPNASCPCHTSLLNILNVAPIQPVKNPQAFHIPSLEVALKCYCTYVANS